MITLVLIIISAICNAVIDVLDDKHPVSIFKKHKKGFWSDANEESWKNKYINGDELQGRKRFLGFVIPVQFTDAWHFFKSLMIILLIGGIVLYIPMCNRIIDFIIYGITWNVIFKLFYKKILIE